MTWTIKRIIFILQNHIKPKTQSYISLVRYVYTCSFTAAVIWKSHLIKHIQLLDHVQRWVTKINYSSHYKSRLIKPHLLPIKYVLDINEIIFFIKSLKSPYDGFPINNFIASATGSAHLASGRSNLKQIRSPDNVNRNFYFNCLPRNGLPTINSQVALSQSYAIIYENTLHYISCPIIIFPCSRCSKTHITSSTLTF